MQNPLIPMVAMTGAPQKDEVFAFVKNMKEKCGFTQLMLYPRTGCEVEYLSEEWFALCSYYLESAAANDMKIWLYDEFNWPAGQAGGRVTAHEAYRLKNLLVKNDGKHVQFDVVLTDYPDILNEEAMNLFLSLTHKEYQKRFGRYFGNTIVGMYTDEPSFGYGTGKERLPYYDGLQEDYRNAYGTDLFSDLESCVTGEKTTGNTLHTGNALLNLSAFGKPGIDEIGTCIAYGTTTLEWLLPLADAFSVQSRHGAMAELFAFGPYDMSHVKEVQMLALTALHGINTWFLAVGHFDMRGNMAKKRYFRNYTDACPDCEAYKELAHRAEQFTLLAAKERACPIRILYLDGKLLSAEQADTFLPWAFGKFYHCTAPVYLAAGTHRVRMENVLDDVKFLPLLLAYGDFAVDYEHTALKAQETPKPGDAVGFFGEASYTATVTVPCVSQGFALYFGTRCALYKRLFIDGERMGDGGLGNLGL